MKLGSMEFLNYHHLRYFWAVAKEGGLTKAAVKLHVSQPTISAQIQALEGALGEKLLRRAGRNLVLTEAGHQVLSYAEEIFSLGEDLMNLVKQQPTARPLRLNIGVADALPKQITYTILKPVFHLDRPVQISCWETKVADLLAQMAAYRLDLVLADEPASSQSVHVFNHLLGECGVTFCAEAKLAGKLRHALGVTPLAGEVVSRYRHSAAVGQRVRGSCVHPGPRFPRPGFHARRFARGEGSHHAVWF